MPLRIGISPGRRNDAFAAGRWTRAPVAAGWGCCSNDVQTGWSRNLGFLTSSSGLADPEDSAYLLMALDASANVKALQPVKSLEGKEKVTTLHFYVQETLKGDHPSAIEVAGPKDNSSNQTLPFGTVLVIDDPLTEGSDPNSKVVGRAQGLAVSAGQQQLLFVLAVDLGFTSGEFNGSSLSVLSRNPVLETERELAVVGGLGKFRMARGFAKLRTYYSNVTLGVNIIEYTVTVFHYESVV
ncbi:hypothetical protein J5N97_021902 [Dioscorea zingiberensis]|uniref:Dirigent protein n=1 Tax=Dioscorea zingiberensis TaxID=325984 RepID=A0A9D5CAV8_9LILI|nr:hypothetical protein J5N97_021902 [Dioscorea zingiberensis]